MEYKVCIKCGERKPLEEFLLNKNTCVFCGKIYLKKYWEEKALAINEKRKQKLLELKKNKEEYEIFLEKKRGVNREQWAKKIGKNKNDIALNRELKKAQSLIDKEFKKLSKNHTVKKGNIFYSEIIKQKRIDDPQYKLKDNLRARIRKAMKKQWAGKQSNTTELLGMSGKEFYEYFLSLGYNKETDTIDHIVPISRFDLTKHEHQLVSCHYLNLRPLPCFENYSKHDSLIDGWQDKIYQICEVRNINPDSIIQHIEAGVACQLSV